MNKWLDFLQSFMALNQLWGWYFSGHWRFTSEPSSSSLATTHSFGVPRCSQISMLLCKPFVLLRIPFPSLLCLDYLHQFFKIQQNDLLFEEDFCGPHLAHQAGFICTFLFLGFPMHSCLSTLTYTVITANYQTLPGWESVFPSCLLADIMTHNLPVIGRVLKKKG